MSIKRLKDDVESAEERLARRDCGGAFDALTTAYERLGGLLAKQRRGVKPTVARLERAENAFRHNCIRYR
jgi:hypothetical protein